MNYQASHVPRPHVESISGLRNSALESEGVRAATKAYAVAQGMEVDDVERPAASILETMAARMDYKAVRKFGWLLRKVYRNMCDQIHVDETGLTQICDLLADRRGSVVHVPIVRGLCAHELRHLRLLHPCSMRCRWRRLYMRVPLSHCCVSLEITTFAGRFLTRYIPLCSRAYAPYLVSRGHTIEFFIEG